MELKLEQSPKDRATQARLNSAARGGVSMEATRGFNVLQGPRDKSPAQQRETETPISRACEIRLLLWATSLERETCPLRFKHSGACRGPGLWKFHPHVFWNPGWCVYGTGRELRPSLALALLTLGWARTWVHTAVLPVLSRVTLSACPYCPSPKLQWRV